MNDSVRSIESIITSNTPHYSLLLQWGKHLPPITYRRTNLHPYNQTPPDVDAILPVVLVRDPYRWMQAMCKAPYDARWHKLPDNRCPNLWNAYNSTTYSLNVRTQQTQFRHVDHYESLADMWTQFNRQYWNATFPRLMIRFEDTLTHAEEIVGAIRDCVGLEPSQEQFHFVLQVLKRHGQPSDFVQSLRSMATDDNKHRGMNKEDRVYAQTALDPELMTAFRYKYAPLSVPPQDVQGPFPELGQPSYLKEHWKERMGY